MTAGSAFQPRPHLRTLRGAMYMRLQALRGFPVDRFARELANAEALPQAEFDRRCAGRLAEALAFARREVPLYGSDGWHVVPASNAGTITPWPVLDRLTVMERYDELRARRPGQDSLTHHTSGSTGTSLRIKLSHDAEAWGWAHRYRGLLWHGLPIGARALRLSHNRRPFRDFLLDQGCFTSLGERGAVDAALEYLRERRPLMVTGSPSKLFYLARGLRERGIEAPLVPYARVGGEQLFGFQRTAIERHLAARVLDSYGCTEIGAVAGECEAGSMHVYADHVYLEIFDGEATAAAGEFGDVVLTSLRNRAMPLVRYRVGDRARLLPGACRCGLPHPVLADLQARTDDAFMGADGRRRHASELVAPLEAVYANPEADGIRQIQFEQAGPLAWRAWAEEVDKQPLPASVEAQLKAIVRGVAGEGSQVDVRVTDVLPRERGKFRYYRLRVPQ